MVLEADFLRPLNKQILNPYNMLLGMKKNKRAFRSLWISRINAASRNLGVSYSSLVNGLAKKILNFDRKVLSDIAINDPATF